MELEEGEFRFDDPDRMSVVDQSWTESVKSSAVDRTLNLNEKPTPSDSIPKIMKMNKKNKNPLVCGVCNVEFSSYQALGGHKASHNKRKIVIHDEGGKRTFNISVARSCKGEKTGKTSVAGAAPERKKSGGAAAAAVVVVAGSSRGLNLDLNLPPPAEEM